MTMTIVRRLARPLLAAPLVASGVDAFRHPGPHAEAARPVLAKASGPLKLPNDPELVVRASGAVTAAAGVLLATGRLPRLAALAIVATAPVAQASTPFWQEKDPEAKRAQRSTFLKNLGLVGGALLAAVDTEGRPGLAYRGRVATKAVTEGVQDTGKAASKAAKRAKKDAKRSAKLAKAGAKGTAKGAKGSLKGAAKAAKSAVPV